MREAMQVIVTGASKGIGAGIARVLAREGCTVGMMARSEALLQQLSDSLAGPGRSIHFAACDIRDPEAAGAAVDDLAGRMGGLYGLINNAGLVTRKSVLEISLDEWHAMVDTNLNGLFYATRAALPHMRAAGAGHVINVSSISGKFPLPGGSGYAATKYGVTGFSQSLFQEVRELGVKVSTVFPGSVDSASHRHGAGEDHGWKVTPEEVGESCLHLLRTRQANCISELEIRPLGRPPK